jgi:hypothetical protein
MLPMCLPDVEDHAEPGPYLDSIRMKNAASPEYPQILTHFCVQAERHGPYSPVHSEKLVASVLAVLETSAA